MNRLQNVLLVDDDESTNRYHEIIINQLGFEGAVQKAKNGKVALDLLHEVKDEAFPEVIFLDLNMPVMDGFRFVELFQKTDLFKEKKPTVIVLTTSLIPEEKKRVLKNRNIHMFLNKLMNKKSLQDIIDKVFEQRN